MSQPMSDSFWMPPSAATNADLVDYVYFFLYWTSVISFVLIIGALVHFAWRYRQKSRDERPGRGSSHNTLLEVSWSLPVAGVSVFIFYFGAVGYIDAKTPPREAYEIKVDAFKWGWAFTYPNGHVDSDLHVPQGEPVRLVMGSQDVIHSLFIPAFRIKQDVVPGRYTSTWFEATRPGTYDIFCAEYCGTRHSEMRAQVVVEPPLEFRAWLEDAGGSLDDLPPAEAGEKLFARNACAGCHSVDGTPKVGPTLKGLFGRERVFADGTRATADENYIKQSILNPKGQLVAGFGPVMPTFAGRLEDGEIDAIIAYIKTLED